MKQWSALLGLSVLLWGVACGGNPTTAPLPTAPPIKATRTLAPTIMPTASPPTQPAMPLATATTLPSPTAMSTANEPTAMAAPVTPTSLPTPTNTSLPGASALPAPTQFHGDAAAGAVLFEKMGCKGCHMPPPQAQRIAPDLKNILTDANEFIHSPDYKGAATDAPSYIRESIVAPNAFVVPAYRYLTLDGSSIMPLDFGQRLSADQINDLIAYVLTLP